VFSGRGRGRIQNSDRGVSVQNAIKPKMRKYQPISGEVEKKENQNDLCNSIIPIPPDVGIHYQAGDKMSNV